MERAGEGEFFAKAGEMEIAGCVDAECGAGAPAISFGRR